MKKSDELRKKAARVDILENIYDVVLRQMQWDAMVATDELDDEGKTIFIDPENMDDETYSGWITHREVKQVYQTVLDTIEKLADKI